MINKKTNKNKFAIKQDFDNILPFFINLPIL